MAVLKSGLVSKSYPVVGATPDAKIVDYGCSICFSLGQVKCPHTKWNVTPLEACSDSNYFMAKLSDTECRLKRNHPYYTQVQGPKWCDFIVYTSKGIYIERTAFDLIFWQNLRTELLNYYFKHFQKFA